MTRYFLSWRPLILSAVTLLGAFSAKAQPVAEIYLAHTQSQITLDDPAGVMAADFKQRVEAATKGAVLVHIFPESRLGGNRELAKLVESNIVQTALVTAGGLVPQYPLIAATQLPFLIESRAAGRALYDGAFGQQLAADMEAKTGFVVLGFGEPGGLQIITNSQRPVVHPQDMAGLKIRSVPGLSSLDAMIRSLGGKAVKVSSREEYNALGSGVIDGQMLPSSVVLGRRFDEVQKYATLTYHLYSPYVWIFNGQAFNALSPDVQGVVRDAAKAGIAHGYEVARAWESSESGLPLLRRRMKVLDLSPSQRAEFAAITQPAVKADLAKTLGPDGQDWLERMITATGGINTNRP